MNLDFSPEDAAFREEARTFIAQNYPKELREKQNRGEDVVERMRRRNILVKTRSLRRVAEEAPSAYKDVSEVVDVTHAAGLARKVARLEPLICVKG